MIRLAVVISRGVDSRTGRAYGEYRVWPCRYDSWAPVGSNSMQSDATRRNGPMKEIHPGDHVVGTALDGETIEVYKVVKVAPDGIQVEETSGKLSSGSLRLYDEAVVLEIMKRDKQIKELKQEIRKLFDSLQTIG